MTESSDQAQLDADANFVANMKAAREARGWTQAAMAAELGKIGVDLSQSAISRIEKGERDVRLHEAREIARLLGASLDLMSGDPAAFQEVILWNQTRGIFIATWHEAQGLVAAYQEAAATLRDFLNKHPYIVDREEAGRLGRMLEYTLRFETNRAPTPLLDSLLGESAGEWSDDGTR